MTFVRIPRMGMQFYANGTLKGMIDGDEFSNVFLSIWFGNSTVAT